VEFPSLPHGQPRVTLKSLRQNSNQLIGSAEESEKAGGVWTQKSLSNAHSSSSAVPFVEPGDEPGNSNKPKKNKKSKQVLMYVGGS